MKDFEKQGGISFFLLFYTNRNEMYYLSLAKLLIFYDRAEQGGRKSFLFSEIEKEYQIHQDGMAFVHYLPLIQKDLLEREEKDKKVIH